MIALGAASDSALAADARDPARQQIMPLPRIAIQAFCELPDLAATIQSAALDRRAERAHVKVQMGGAAACLEAFRAQPTPNVIIIEAMSDRGLLLAQLDELASYCDEGTKVVVVGHVNDVILYRELMRRGVSDYLIAPVPVLDLLKALSDLFGAPDAEPLGRVIAVMGSKGGVGASTIAHNIGWSIARQLQIQTVIADLDLPFGTAGLDFNQDPPQGIAEAVFSPERLDSNFVDRLLSKCSDNLTLLAAPATLDRQYDFQETTFDALLDLLRASTPCILLDVPHMWTAWSRRMLVGADQVALVCAPDLANLRNAKSILDVLRQARPNDQKPVLIMNQVGVPKKPEIATADFAKALDLEPSAVIPFDAQLFGTAANNGQMLSEVASKNKAAETLAEVARLLTGRGETRQARRSMLQPFLQKLGVKKA